MRERLLTYVGVISSPGWVLEMTALSLGPLRLYVMMNRFIGLHKKFKVTEIVCDKMLYNIQ